MKSARRLLASSLCATLCCISWPQTAAAAGVDCLETDAALAYWRPLREQAAETELPADTLSLELVSCLASPNAELRDRIGYELFTYWLRQEKLSDEIRWTLVLKLSDNLSSDKALLRSFSALILAEVMRSDASNSFMTTSQRDELLPVVAIALDRETDFRGLDPDIGWVHPVAHMADVLWRFALHPDCSGEQATAILAAVRTKVAPTEVSYAFNEGDRLARAVATLIERGLLAPEVAGEWIGRFQSPKSMEKWSDAFQSPVGMAELHNTKQFLRALADQLAGSDLDPVIAEPLNALVNGFTQLI
ncbi:MAG: DUF2785 domain-containing protein [Woeseiaceae bacterium]